MMTLNNSTLMIFFIALLVWFNLIRFHPSMAVKQENISNNDLAMTSNNNVGSVLGRAMLPGSVSQHYCGRLLTAVLQLVCKGQYNGPSVN